MRRYVWKGVLQANVEAQTNCGGAGAAEGLNTKTSISMRTLLNAQPASLNCSLATGATSAAAAAVSASSPSSSSSSSCVVPPPTFDPNRNLQPPGIPVSSSLALSTSLLQAADPLKALSCLQRTNTGTHSLETVTHSAHVQNPNNFDVSKGDCHDHDSRWATHSYGAKTSGIGENLGEEMPSVSRKCTSPQEDDDFNRKNVEDTALNLEKIEHRAKASIEKLRHILLRVKIRSPKVPSPVTERPRETCEEGQEQTIETTKRGSIQNNTCCGTPPSSLGVDQNGNGTELMKSTPNDPEIRAAAFQNSSDTQNEAITYTKSTVKFNKDTNTAIVTLVATVKGDLLDPSEHMKEKTIILAAQALSCVCASLEAKASNVFSNYSKGTMSRVAMLKPAMQTDDEAAHSSIVQQLENGEITEAIEVKKGYGATPFRPVYVIRLLSQDGSVAHAIFKPYIAADTHSYSSASPEWVAYQLGLLLDTDMVPPAVMRQNVQVGDNLFPLGTVVHFVPNVKILSRVGPQEWGAESSVTFVSNVHVLDALVGSIPRERRYFMEGLHWIRHGTRRPMLLHHPHGCCSTGNNDQLHPMWNPKSSSRGVQKVSHKTIVALRSVEMSLMQEKLQAHVAMEEMKKILQRRDQVVDYFYTISRNVPALIV